MCTGVEEEEEVFRDEGLFCGEKGRAVALWKSEVVCRGLVWWNIKLLVLLHVFFCSI